MHRFIHLFVCLIAGALSAKPDTAVSPFVFFNSHTFMCLQPNHGSAGLTARIVQAPCDGSAPQVWLYIPLGAAGYHFENAYSGFCLETKGGPANGAPIQLWDCAELTNENWRIAAVSKGVATTLVSGVEGGKNGYCLDVPGGQAVSGLAMQLYKCNGTVSQKWLLNSVSSVVVPNILVLSLPIAVGKAMLYGLKPDVQPPPGCAVAGDIIKGQDLAPFTLVALNTTLHISVNCAGAK